MQILEVLFSDYLQENYALGNNIKYNTKCTVKLLY